jgi:membrane protease YdiL (CAAX protease family)
MFSYVVLGDTRYDLHLLFNDLALFVTTCVIGLIYRESLAVQVGRLGFDKLEAWIGLGLLGPTLGLNYLYHVLFMRSILPHNSHSFFDHLRAFASFLFAAMHFSIVSFPYLFLVGALLGWTKWKTGSLYPSMLIHFLHNFIVIETFPL